MAGRIVLGPVKWEITHGLIRKESMLGRWYPTRLGQGGTKYGLMDLREGAANWCGGVNLPGSADGSRSIEEETLGGTRVEDLGEKIVSSIFWGLREVGAPRLMLNYLSSYPW